MAAIDGSAEGESKWDIYGEIKRKSYEMGFYWGPGVGRKFYLGNEQYKTGNFIVSVSY